MENVRSELDWKTKRSVVKMMSDYRANLRQVRKMKTEPPADVPKKPAKQSEEEEQEQQEQQEDVHAGEAGDDGLGG
jgi:hypothetical protein